MCDIEITDKNDTKEHIIPNAIGGRRKVSGFICDDCNNKSGSNWEAELAKQLNPLSLLFDVKRERGKAPSQVFEMLSGEKIKLHNNGEMEQALSTYKKNQAGGVHMTVGNQKEAKKRIKDIKKKRPEANIDFQMKHETHYPSEPINIDLSFGGLSAGRSLVKSALAVVFACDIDPHCCEQALCYLKNDDAEPCFGYFYSSDPIIDRPIGMPIHCIYVKGDPVENLIIGYVEFFGYQRVALCLSNNYQGKFFEGYYVINPLDGTEQNLKFQFSLTPEMVSDCYNYNLIPEGSIEQSLGYVLDTAILRDFEREKKRVIDSAVQYGFENCGAENGAELTPEQYKKMYQLVLEKMRPFIQSKVHR